MRNTHIDLHDALDRALVAIGNDYPAGHLLDAHAHRRAQLLYGATGVMLVLSEDGGWVVPPQRAVWIPAGVTHQVRMLGSARAAPTSSWRGARTRGPAKWWRCRAVAPAAAGGRGHAGAVRQGRARRRAGPTAAARGGPRAGAAAAHPAAARAAGGVVPGLHGGAGHPLAPQDWAGRLHMSPRSFSRHFREHTGMSYAQWRQRACVVLALARLAAGDPSPSSRWISATRARPRSQRCSGACWARRPPPTCAPTRTLHSTQEVLLQQDAAEPALPVRRHALGKRVSASGCQPLAYQRTAKKWQAVPASTNRCQTKCA